MHIPDKIKILGYDYTIKMIDLNETEKFGNLDMNTLTIRLNENKAQSQIDSTLLHEIIEAINFHLGLELKHYQINALEAGLYQVLKDNNINFREGCE